MRKEKGQSHFRLEYWPGASRGSILALAPGSRSKPEPSCCLFQAGIAHLMGEEASIWGEDGEDLQLSLPPVAPSIPMFAPFFPLLALCSGSCPSSPNLTQLRTTASLGQAKLGLRLCCFWLPQRSRVATDW